MKIMRCNTMNRIIIVAALHICLIMAGCSASENNVIVKNDNPVKQTANEVINQGGTKQLTMEIVKELSHKKDQLRAEDFADYMGRAVGSGLYIMEYPVDENYFLMVGSSAPNGKLLYVFLNKKGSEKRIDIRNENIDEFLER